MKQEGGRGGQGVRIGGEETTSKNIIKKILTPENIPLAWNHAPLQIPC